MHSLERPSLRSSLGLHLVRYKRVFPQVSGAARSAAAHQVAKFEYDGISNAIENAISRTLTTDQPGVKENLQVLRNVGLISIKGADDLADGHRSTLKRP